MSKLSVGYAKVDITPRESVYLTGYGNDALRCSDNVLDPLYATCLAFTDEEGSTALVYTIDILYACSWMREAVSEATGLPVERVQISATHTHAGPSTWPMRAQANNREYLLGTLRAGLIEAANKALADRKPADMYITDTHTVGLNYVRHYLMEDGTYSGPNFGSWDKAIVGHETQADNQLQLVKFVREGKKDIIIANFGVHQTSTGGMNKHDISADSAGAMRAKMERELNCCFAYFTGAAGNIAPVSKIKTELSLGDHVDHGRALAGYAIRANDTYKPVETGHVRVKSLQLDIDVNHSLDHMEEIAKSIVDVWKKTGNRAECNKVCWRHGLNSVYHAESVLDKLALGKTLDIQLNVVSVGDVAFVMMPYEVFDTNAVFIKQNAPYKMSVIATCANDVRSYIPSDIGFAHGGYSVDRCRFVPGTGERLADEFVAMLQELHE